MLPTFNVVGEPGFSPFTTTAFLGSGAAGVTVKVLTLHGNEPENRRTLDILHTALVSRYYDSSVPLLHNLF